MEKCELVVKAYANMDEVCRALVTSGTVRKPVVFRHFWHGFVSQRALFDVIDVGSGKERANNKIRGTPNKSQEVSGN